MIENSINYEFLIQKQRDNLGCQPYGWFNFLPVTGKPHGFFFKQIKNIKLVPIELAFY